MKCPHCQKLIYTNPLKMAAGALNCGLMALAFDNFSAQSKFWSSFIVCGFWVSVVSGALAAVFFLLFAGAWIYDPDGYYHRST